MATCEVYGPNDFFMDFPHLDKTKEPTSPWTRSYNCIAYSMNFTNGWWWPEGKDAYWPPGCPKEATIMAFECAFATQGYRPCENAEVEEGYEKIALYAKEQEPTHAARQQPNGCWTSKCGGNVDIEHELEELEGPCYGVVITFFRRPRPAS